jgi:hypothetical protein
LKRGQWYGSPVCDAACDGATKIGAHSDEARVMYVAREGGMTGQFVDGISDVEAASDIGVDEFAEDTAI